MPVAVTGCIAGPEVAGAEQILVGGHVERRAALVAQDCRYPPVTENGVGYSRHSTAERLTFGDRQVVHDGDRKGLRPVRAGYGFVRPPIVGVLSARLVSDFAVHIANELGKCV